jgi:cobalt-zinc-cadmium efflux system outer membrane protein
MKLFLLFLIFFTQLNADSIRQLITETIEDHPSLQSIKHKLSAMDARIEASDNFSNPEFSLTINNIQLDDISNRSIEPMQYEAVNVKQTIPWFGKLDAKKNVARTQKDLVLNSYESAKVKLAQEIRTTAYTLKELELRITILNRYKSLVSQNIKLYTSYASTQTKSHSSSVSASLLLAKVKIREKRYSSVYKSQQAKLHYLTHKNVVSISDPLHITAPKPLKFYLSKLEHNPTYKMNQSKTKVASANKTIQVLNEQADPYVKMGYFHRAAYEDYASLTVGISYPLYGTEEHNTQAARQEMLSAQSDALDYRFSLKRDIETMYAKLNEAYAIYTIIHTESLPQLEHMIELAESKIQRGGDLFAYTNLLEQKLALEEERISTQAQFLRTEAQLNALTGEI